MRGPAPIFISMKRRLISVLAHLPMRASQPPQEPLTKPAAASHLRLLTRVPNNVLAITDDRTARAVQFIHEHASRIVRVRDVIAEAAISRSGLELRFKKELGCTIHAAIRQVQLDRVRRLVVETKMPLKEIAVNSGFKTVQHMTRLFTQTFHQPPAKYRKAAI